MGSPTQVPCGADRVHEQVVHRIGVRHWSRSWSGGCCSNGIVQVPATLADLLTFLEASVLYTLCVAEIHRLEREDIERRRLLVTGMLVRNSASMQGA